eukprot:Awhi_evm1s1583
MKISILVSEFALFTYILAGKLPTKNEEELQEFYELNKMGNNVPFNTKTDYTYTTPIDCSASGNNCPKGQYCQLFYRDNWYPYSENFLTRGRCVSFQTEGMACQYNFVDVKNQYSVSDWVKPPLTCHPDLACTKNEIVAMPPTCVRIKDKQNPCYSTLPRCAGRTPPLPLPNGSGLDWKAWENSGECQESFCPNVESQGLNRAELEQCAGIVMSEYNGENFAMLVKSDKDGTNEDWNSPNEKQFNEPDETLEAKMIDLSNNRMSMLNKQANSFLEKLWPFEKCNDKKKENCTQFPLKPVKAMKDLPSTYQCSWALFHTLANNGNRALRQNQVDAFRDLILFRNHFCVVCRSNFAHLVKELGIPDSYNRELYSKWFWQAHNNANEHSYATHSLANKLAPRMSDWANPNYENP